ncbi:hypothetical protein [Microbispora sp. NPDC049125]|uniref:hypothetical protein n=1 Tax=Microbispora sp. NPDC049125 TaxID=3154929 RepID=UPI0034673337
MKPLVAAAAALLLAGAPSAAEARTAAPDPLKTVLALLAKGGSAKIETLAGVSTDQYEKDEAAHTYWTGGYELSGTGRLQVGPKGVVAAEMTRKLAFGTKARQLMARDARTDRYCAWVLASEGITRTVSVKGRQYQSPPKAGKWVDLGRSSGAAAAYGDQVINVFEPATLRKLLSGVDKRSASDWYKDRTTGRRQRIYTLSGNITFAELYKVSPSFREAAGANTNGAVEVTWTYMYDDRGLPYRVGWRFYALPQKNQGIGQGRITRLYLATQYRGWGTNTSIRAPKAAPGEGLAADEILDILRAPQRRPS